MQMNEQVLTALEVLKNFAENDFERHRIDVLISDLTAPPKVEIIDDTHQKFNGVTYNLHNSSNRYLVQRHIYRDVWFYYNGEIPDGDYEIHHRNWDKSDNNITNLQLLTKAEHTKIHHVKKNKPITKIVQCVVCNKNFNVPIRSTRKCCSTTCLKIALGKSGAKNVKPPVQKICPECGKNFTVKHGKNNQIYCSFECSKIALARKRKKTIIERICPACGKKFIVSRSSPKTIHCSKECAAKMTGLKLKKPLIEKICPVCGKTFTLPRNEVRTICCSRACGAKMRMNKKQKH